MHEIAIAVSLVEAASEELARLGDVRIEAIHIRLGPFAGVVREALCGSFEMAKAGTPLADARLQIEDVAATVWCDACAAERPLSSLAHRVCPTCGAVAPTLVSGDELEVVGLEVAAT